MERRTLLAILLIMAVLIGDQILTSTWSRKRQPAPPAPTSGQPDMSAREPGTGEPVQPPPPGGAMGTGVVPPGGAEAPGVATPPGDVATPGGATATAPTGAPPATTRPRVLPAPSVTRQIQSEHFLATFTSEGGSISRWVLPRYKDLTRNEGPVDLVRPDERALKLVVSTPYFSYDFTNAPFRLDEGSLSDTSITFTAKDSNGVWVSKSYRQASGSRALDVEIRINVPPQYGPIHYRWSWAGALPVTEPHANPHQIQAVALVGDKLETLDAEKLQKSGARSFKGNVRFAGNRSKYFVAALIPDSATVEDVQLSAGSRAEPTAWLAGAAPPGTDIVRRARLYAGPIHYETLVAQGAELDRLANLGWRWIMGVSALLLSCLNFLYKLIPNYGVAIIVLSAATKLVFYPLTQSSLRSMKLMHHLQPQVKALQDRHKGDPTKMNQAMMALYKQNKVNPLSGCLPMLLQIPVFIALYNVLLNSIELRGAGFVGYVRDLSVPDVLFTVAGFSLHLFPILMTGSTYLMQAQTPVAPQQKTMMMLMPVMMLVFMYTFPSGVILYWTVNNVLSAAQQYLVNVAEDRKMAAGG